MFVFNGKPIGLEKERDARRDVIRWVRDISFEIEGKNSLAIRVNGVFTMRGEALLHEVLSIFNGEKTIEEVGENMFRSIALEKNTWEWNRKPFIRERQFECNF